MVLAELIFGRQADTTLGFFVGWLVGWLVGSFVRWDLMARLEALLDVLNKSNTTTTTTTFGAVILCRRIKILSFDYYMKMLILV